jgi:hypothetical protein
MARDSFDSHGLDGHALFGEHGQIVGSPVDKAAERILQAEWAFGVGPELDGLRQCERLLGGECGAVVGWALCGRFQLDCPGILGRE